MGSFGCHWTLSNLYHCKAVQQESSAAEFVNVVTDDSTIVANKTSEVALKAIRLSVPAEDNGMVAVYSNLTVSTFVLLRLNLSIMRVEMTYRKPQGLVKAREISGTSSFSGRGLIRRGGGLFGSKGSNSFPSHADSAHNTAHDNNPAYVSKGGYVCAINSNNSLIYRANEQRTPSSAVLLSSASFVFHVRVQEVTTAVCQSYYSHGVVLSSRWRTYGEFMVYGSSVCGGQLVRNVIRQVKEYCRPL